MAVTTSRPRAADPADLGRYWLVARYEPAGYWLRATDQPTFLS